MAITNSDLPSSGWSELRRCSPRSQPNILSRTIPDLFKSVRDGRVEKKLRRNAINLPCLLATTKKCKN